MASEPTARRSSKSRTKPAVTQEPNVKEPEKRAARRPARSTDPHSGFGRIQNSLRDTIAEIKKVTWPDAQTTRNLTIVVIAMAFVLGILLGSIDAIFVRLWDNIPSI